MNPFKAIPIYIKIYINKIEVIRLDSEELSQVISTEPFSSNRLCFSDYNVAELTIRNTINGLVKQRKFWGYSFRILIHQLDKIEGGLSQIEKRALRDIGEQVGGSYVIIYEGEKPLSIEEARIEIQSKQ